MGAAMIEVVAMVYKSPEFLAFIRDQLVRYGGPCTRIVANDPDYNLAWEGDTYHDPNPDDWYLSRVYRCWNYCVESSRADYVCLVNSDMAFSPGWLDALASRLDGKTLPCSRLIEPGFLRPGKHAIQIDLGRDPTDFPEEPWLAVVDDLSDKRVEAGGLFMPCVFERKAFLNAGGYPSGNVDGISGDAYFFGKMADAGYAHVTCFDSLVYHMQEGEMRHPK